MRKVKNIFIIGLFLFLVVLPCNGFTFNPSIPLEERVLLFDMGDGGSRFYRIPGIVTAADGSLVVVADRRWDKINDLPAHIDVVSRRSEDNGKTWSEAKAACESKGSGWRLPTQREMYLVLGMGGAVTNIENQGFGDSTTWTGNGFEKISAVHWTLTSRDSNYWLVGHNNGEFGAWATVESTTWAWYRCVRTIE